MQLINKSDLLAPGVCVLCEGSPADEHKIVDTLKNLVTGFPHQLEGRKYVCEACIKNVGEVIGLVSAEDRDEAVLKAAEAEAKLVAVGGFLDGLADEIRAGKFAQIIQHAAVPAEEIKSGIEAAVEAGTDPGAVSIAGPAAPAEADGPTVTAAEAEAAHAEAAPPTFDPSITDAAPKTSEAKKKAPKPKTEDEIAAENPPIAAEVAAQKEQEAAVEAAKKAAAEKEAK
jgi:hypothetical protein